jgi:hypothetical protein
MTKQAWYNLWSSINFDNYNVALVTLCDKGIKQSQSPRETDDSESNFKDKPNSHAWNTKGSFRSNHLPFIPTRGSDPPQATAGPYALPKCRTYACSVTTCPYSWLPLQHVFLHVQSSNRKNQNTSGGRYVHSSG